MCYIILEILIIPVRFGALRFFAQKYPVRPLSSPYQGLVKVPVVFMKVLLSALYFVLSDAKPATTCGYPFIPPHAAIMPGLTKVSPGPTMVSRPYENAVIFVSPDQFQKHLSDRHLYTSTTYLAGQQRREKRKPHHQKILKHRRTTQLFQRSNINMKQVAVSTHHPKISHCIQAQVYDRVLKMLIRIAVKMYSHLRSRCVPVQSFFFKKKPVSTVLSTTENSGLLCGKR